MPVLTYDSFSQLLAVASERNQTLAEVALAYEAQRSGREPAVILAQLEGILAQMRQTVASGVASTDPSVSGLTGGDAHRVMAFLKHPSCVPSAFMVRIMAYALATLEENARMKKVVACPTAGGSGSVPAVLVALEDEHGLDKTLTVQGLLTAAVVGEVTGRRLLLSGAGNGCQAEVGVASGMAASGMVALLGLNNGDETQANNQQALAAAAIAMQHSLGLVCDPVAGLVEVPCVLRNGLAAVTAATAATLALAGVKSFIPLDEVIDAMVEVGRLMSPKLKESSEAGLAQTKTARAFEQKLFAPNLNPLGNPPPPSAS